MLIKLHCAFLYLQSRRCLSHTPQTQHRHRRATGFTFNTITSFNANQAQVRGTLTDPQSRNRNFLALFGGVPSDQLFRSPDQSRARSGPGDFTVNQLRAFDPFAENTGTYLINSTTGPKLWDGVAAPVNMFGPDTGAFAALDHVATWIAPSGDFVFGISKAAGNRSWIWRAGDLYPTYLADPRTLSSGESNSFDTTVALYRNGDRLLGVKYFQGLNIVRRMEISGAPAGAVSTPADPNDATRQAGQSSDGLFNIPTGLFIRPDSLAVSNDSTNAASLKVVGSIGTSVNSSTNIGIGGRAFFWSQATGLKFIDDPFSSTFATFSEAKAVNPTGEIVVGFFEEDAIRWNPLAPGRDVTVLNRLPGDSGAEATGVSDDGNVIVGRSYNFGTGA